MLQRCHPHAAEDDGTSEGTTVMESTLKGGDFTDEVIQ